MSTKLPIDIVLLTFGKEFPVLTLHIESLRRNVDKKYINNIFVLVNDRYDERSAVETIQRKYLNQFNELEDKVRIVSGLSLLGDTYYTECKVKEISNPGFLAQMITDCAIANLITTEYYIVIDSKSLFLNTDWQDKLVKNNKFYLPLQPLYTSNSKDFWQINRQFFESTVDSYAKFMPMIVRPHVYHAASMQEMMLAVEKKSGMTWVEFMIDDYSRQNEVSGIIHYFLYCAYLWKTNTISELYEVDAPGIQLDCRIYDVTKFSWNEEWDQYLTVTIARSIFVEQPWAKHEVLNLWKVALPDSNILEETFDEMAKINTLSDS